MPGSFTDLKIWKKGYELVLKVYKISNDFPDKEKFGRTHQLRRSANSIIANIAESHGRFHYKDKIKTLYIARGELNETRSHILIAKGLYYLPDDDAESLDRDFDGLGAGINAYINSLKKT